MGDPWETQGLHGGASGDLREALGEPWVGLEGLLGPSKESEGGGPASQEEGPERGKSGHTLKMPIIQEKQYNY